LLRQKSIVKESRIDSRTTSSGIASREDNYWKRILIVDDESDITTTLKLAIENSNETCARRIVVNTYNDPRLVLVDFEPNLYVLIGRY
jgi:predicted phosphoribosyltransferase